MTIKQPFKQGADFEYLRKVLMREVTGGPVPIIELIVDGDPMSAVTGLPTPISSMLDLVNFVEDDGSVTDESFARGMQLLDLSLAFAGAEGNDFVATHSKPPAGGET